MTRNVVERGRWGVERRGGQEGGVLEFRRWKKARRARWTTTQSLYMWVRESSEELQKKHLGTSETARLFWCRMRREVARALWMREKW